MWCELCGTASDGLLCPTCGDDRREARIAYRDQVRATVIGWHRVGVLDAGALAAVVARIAREQAALRPVVRQQAPVAAPVPSAPAPAPAPPPRVEPVAWPVPRPEARRTASLGAAARASAGWLVGAALTVTGSVYLAGTLWGGLSAGWRTALTLAFLAAGALGFGAAGRRLVARGFPAGRWLVGVGAALAPVHAMAAGTAWPSPWVVVGVGFVALVQGWAVRRAAATLSPGAGARTWVPWLALSLLPAAIPAGLGLVVPTVALAAAVWGMGVAPGGPRGSVAAVLAFAYGLHLVVGGPYPVVAWAPALAVGAALALYLDLLWARWRGLSRIGLEGWRGVGVLALGLGAAAATAPSFAPLPSGFGVLATYALLGGVSLASAVAWRRPALVGGSVIACLGVALALPSLAESWVAWAAGRASVGLGYGGEVLPLAWRATTLLPWLGLWQLAARGLRGTGWRQAPALEAHLRGWTFGVAVALLALAPTLPDDPRPFLLAAPLYAALGLLRPRLSAPAPVAVAIAGVPVGVAVGWVALAVPWLGAPGWLAQAATAAALAGVVAGWPDRRVRPLGWLLSPVVLALGPAWTGLVAVAAVGAVAAAVEPDRRVARALSAGFPVVGWVGAVGAWGPVWGGFGAALVAAAASEGWLRAGRPHRELLGWAAAAVAFAGFAATTVPDPARGAIHAALGAVLVGWAWSHRDARVGRWPLAPAFGFAFALGLASTVARRVGAELPITATVAAAVVAGWRFAGARSGVRWVVDGLAEPAAVVALAACGVAAGLASVGSDASLLGWAPLLGLVLAAWLVDRGPAPAWVAVGLAAVSPFPAATAGVALGLVGVPVVGPVAAALAAAHGALHDPTGAGWVAVAAAVAVGVHHARALAELRIPALLGAVGVGLLALAGLGAPAPAVYPLVVAGLGAAAWGGATHLPWSAAVGWTGRALTLAVVPVAAAFAAWGGSTPTLVAAAAVAAAAIAAGRMPRAARIAAGVAAAAALQVAHADLTGWTWAGVAAVVASRLAPGRDRWTAGAEAVGALALAGLVATGASAVAPAWIALGWLASGYAPAHRRGIVALAVAVAATHAAASAGVGWGFAIGAAVLALDPRAPGRSIALAAGAAALLGLGAGIDGWLALAVIGAAGAAAAALPSDPVDRGVAAASIGVAAVWAAAALVVPLPGPPAVGTGLFVAFAALTRPGRARWWLGPVGALLLAAVVGAERPADAAALAPAVLAGWAALAVGARRPDADLALGLAAAGAAVAFAATGAFDVLTAHLAAVALAAGVGDRRSGAALLAGAAAVAGAFAWAVDPVPVGLVALLGLGWAATRYAPAVSAAARVAVPALAAAAALGADLPPWGWAVWAASVALELGWAVRRSEPGWLAAPLASAGAWVAVARLVGPLAGWPAEALLPAAAAVAVGLEVGAIGLERWRGARFAVPAQLGAAGVLAAAVAHAAVTGAPTAGGLALVGAVACGRHALRGRTADLLAGAAALDAAAIALALDVGWTDPLPYVAPVSLSALVVAQRLRGTLQPTALAALRYAAAGALYLTCFGQSIDDPRYTSALVLLAAAGVGAGELLRVKSYLHLGLGFLGAALGWNLLRFGLDHSQFWALYLTGLGVTVLGSMVALTLHRERVAAVRARVRAHVAAWE